VEKGGLATMAGLPPHLADVRNKVTLGVEVVENVSGRTCAHPSSVGQACRVLAAHARRNTQAAAGSSRVSSSGSLPRSHTAPLPASPTARPRVAYPMDASALRPRQTRQFQSQTPAGHASPHYHPPQRAHVSCPGPVKAPAAHPKQHRAPTSRRLQVSSTAYPGCYPGIDDAFDIEKFKEVG